MKISEKSIDHAVNAFYNGGGVRLYPDGAGTGIGVIDAALSVASKRKTGQRGRPDFIGIFNRDSETLLVIESKADPANHISPGLRGQGAYVKNDFLKGKEVATNACDGALHYAKILSPHYNVLRWASPGCRRTATSPPRTIIISCGEATLLCIFNPMADYGRRASCCAKFAREKKSFVIG